MKGHHAKRLCRSPPLSRHVLLQNIGRERGDNGNNNKGGIICSDCPLSLSLSVYGYPVVLGLGRRGRGTPLFPSYSMFEDVYSYLQTYGKGDVVSVLELIRKGLRDKLIFPLLLEVGGLRFRPPGFR